jgi:hypothetical protein
MGYDTSRQKAAGYVRQQPLDDYVEWTLVVMCDHCERAEAKARLIVGQAK